MIPLHNFSEKSNRYPTRDHDRDWDYLIMARSRHENLDKNRPYFLVLKVLKVQMRETDPQSNRNRTGLARGPR